MTKTDPIRIIRAKGDILEREMFANDAFAAWFEGYAGLWSRHILRRRGPDGHVADLTWREFAA